MLETVAENPSTAGHPAPARALVVLAALLLPLFAPPLSAAETLADAWRDALSVDSRLRAADAESDAARATRDAARALALPRATASSRYTVLSNEPAARIDFPAIPGIALPSQMPLQERSYATHALQATLPLYTGGRITSAVAAAETGVAASGFERTRSEQAVKLDVAEAYLNVLRARRALRAAEHHLAALDAHAADVAELGKQGLVARNDILSVAVARADATQRLTQASNAAQLAAAAYNRLLRRPLDAPVDLTEPPVADARPDDIAALAGRARTLRPEIALLGAQADVTDREADQARAGLRPQVGLSAAAVHEDNRYRVHQNVAQIAVGVEWQLFDGGLLRHQADAARARARAARERQTDAASLIELEVRREWLATDEAARRLATTETAVGQADENLRVARDRYRNGVGTHTEVLDAEALRSLTDYNHLNALYDLHLARLRLRKAVGEL